MRHRARPIFWKLYRELPGDVRELADTNFALLKENPRHPSLRFKKVGKTLWSVRVGLNYRALAREVDGDMRWFWIGPHDEYDAMLSRKRKEF